MTTNQKIAIATANFERYACSTETLFTAYGKPSVAKQAVWGNLIRECAENGGMDLRVVSHNTMVFTAGYLFPDPETGVVMFKYIAPTWSAVIEMPPLA